MATAVKRKWRQRKDAAVSLSLLSMEQSVLEKVVSYFVTSNRVDRDAINATRTVCKRLRGVADAPSVWTELSTLSASGRVCLEKLSLCALKCRGTEGTCMKVAEKGSNTFYALKKARPFPEVLFVNVLPPQPMHYAVSSFIQGEGIPYYVLREVSWLKALAHPNISPLLGVCFEERRLFTLFPYEEYTLQDVLLQRTDRWSAGGSFPAPLPRRDALGLTSQLLSAVSYCHSKGIIHRNIKPKHLLVRMPRQPQRRGPVTPTRTPGPADETDDGADGGWDLSGAVLLLADFALLRSVPVPAKTLTGEMISLWYRPPEVLLGARAYGPAADVWSAGCVVAEMLRGAPLFPGTSQIEQLFLIFSALGTPSEQSWPGFTSSPYYAGGKFPEWDEQRARLSASVRGATSADLDLLARCLVCCPEKRDSAAQLLAHPAFASLHTGSECRDYGSLPAANLADALSWAQTAVGGSAKLRQHCRGKEVVWQRRHQLLYAEGKAGAREKEHLRGLKEQLWYRVLLRALRCVMAAWGRDVRGYSLDRAVQFFDDYAATRWLPVTHTVAEGSAGGAGGAEGAREGQKDISVDELERSNSRADEGGGDGGGSNLPSLGMPERQLAVVLAAAVACLQLASKHEDVDYLEACEVRELAGASLQQRVRDADNEERGEGARAPGAGEDVLVDALLARLIDVPLAVVLLQEETVLCALNFPVGVPTVRGFSGLLLEECCSLLALMLEGGDNEALSADHQRILRLLPNWEVALLKRSRGSWPRCGEPFLRAVCDLLATAAACSPACCSHPASALGAAAVWLAMRLLVLFSDSPWRTQHGCHLQSGAVALSPSPAPIATMRGALEAAFCEALQSWSGYPLPDLRGPAEALLLELRRLVQSEEAERLVFSTMADMSVCEVSLREVVTEVEDLLLLPFQQA